MHRVSSEIIGFPQMSQRRPPSMVKLAAQVQHRGQAEYDSTGPAHTTQVRGAMHDSMTSRIIVNPARGFDIPARIPGIPGGVLEIL
jgi:hypothetical protein